MKRNSTFDPLKIFLLLVMIFLLNSFSSKAADITIVAPTTFAAADASDGTVDGIFTVNGNLTIANGGKITCNAPGANVSACPIVILVSGNMEIQAGGAIYTESHFSNGNGGNDSIVVGGTFTMRGKTGSIPGAVISSGSYVATSGNGNAGFIKIYAGGSFMTGANSVISAFSYKFTGGAIVIVGSSNVDIEGYVLSESTGSGAGTNQGHGGTITITSSTDLLINDSGFVSSRSGDPGADLVHLCGCAVTIYGRVQSTGGSGHGIPSNPPNHLAGTNRPDKPANSTAGVEVWSTSSILIDNNLPHKGVIKADLCCSGGTVGESWIDILAQGNISILGNRIPNDSFAVHANGNAGGSDNGGVITIKSTMGMVILSGRATRSNGSLIGGKTTVQAKMDVDISSVIMEAKGSAANTGTGGIVNIRSFGDVSTGSIISNDTSRIDVTGDNPANGQVNLSGCVTPVYAGVIIPASITPGIATACGGAPTLQSYVVFCGTCDVIPPVPPVNPPCITCSGNEIDVNTNVTINFNTNPPTYTGDPDLLPFYSFDRSGPTPDTWFAAFDLGDNALVIKPGAIIATSMVGSGNNFYAPGLRFYSNCALTVESAGKIMVQSMNKNAGNIIIVVKGNVDLSGEVRNEVTGTLGLPGSIYTSSPCGSINVGSNGRIFDLGVDGGGNLISLLTCGNQDPGDITINGLVKAYAHAHTVNSDTTRPRIKVISSQGSVTVNANSTEPLYDEYSFNGGLYDIWGGLLAWVRDNAAPGKIWVQAGQDITVNGHGTDPTPPVRESFGAIAAITTSSDAPGGLVDIRAGGTIKAYDRSFDVSGRNRLAGYLGTINLLADGDIFLSRPGNTTANPVVDASAPGPGDKGGLNNIRSCNGQIIVDNNAMVSACGAVQGTNSFGISYVINGNVCPTQTTSATCTIAGDLFTCDGSVALTKRSASSGVKNGPAQFKEKEGILLYPNPAKENCNIVFRNQNEIPIKVVLYNLLGQEKMSVLHNSADGDTMTLDLSSYSGGVYFISFIQDGRIMDTRKLIINNDN